MHLHNRIRNKAKTSFRLQLGRIRRWIGPPSFPKREDGRILLHVGCGSVDATGFVNVDLNVAPHIHVRAAIEDLSMFADASVHLVYASHCLEHFSYLRTKDVLTEWARVLVPGGILRVAVPDFAVVARAYAHGRNLMDLQGYLMGAQNYPLNTHLAVFDESALRRVLLDVGLVDVRHWDPETVQDHDFHDDSAHRIVIQGENALLSLNLEATKQ